MTACRRPGVAVEIWAQDEARIGLVPLVRRVWSAKGKRPIAQQRRSYQWLYVYAFVRPSTGEVEWLLLPTVNVELFQIALEHFAKAVGAGASKQILLIVDQAGWHTSQKLHVPEGIRLIPLPSYSPELQPAEKLWPLMHECMANELIPNIDTLEKLLSERCRELQKQPEIIRAHTNYSWWAHAAKAECHAA